MCYIPDYYCLPQFIEVTSIYYPRSVLFLHTQIINQKVTVAVLSSLKADTTGWDLI